MRGKRQRDDDDEEQQPRKSSRLSGVVATKTLKDADERAQQTYRSDAVALARRQLANLPPGDPAELRVAFVYMGQGDCTIVRTPGGRVVLVDCGTSAYDSEPIPGVAASAVTAARKILTGKLFRNGKPISALVLTHGDADHHNRIEQLLPPRTPVKRVYHSGPASDYGTALTHVQAGQVHRVVVTGDKLLPAPAKPTDPIPDGILLTGSGAGTSTKDPLAPELVTGTGVRIVQEDRCTITVIASGVTQKYGVDDGDTVAAKNRGSVVLLIEAYGKKVLLTGDATLSTEEFLRKHRSGHIGNVTVVHAGHHGSARTSSGEEFVKVVNPDRVSISAPRNVASTYHLPSKIVVDRYKQQYRTKVHSTETDADEKTPGDTKHPVWSWPTSTATVNDLSYHTVPVYTTGSQGTTYFVVGPS